VVAVTAPTGFMAAPLRDILACYPHLTLGREPDMPDACRHLLAGHPDGQPRAANLCLAHPTHVLCVPCGQEHVQAHHTEAFELTCDRCGTVCPPGPVAIYAVGVLAPPDTRVRARDLAGRKRTIPGPLHLIGIGACPRCYDELVANGRIAQP
jgi:hypothetical protein